MLLRLRLLLEVGRGRKRGVRSRERGEVRVGETRVGAVLERPALVLPEKRGAFLLVRISLYFPRRVPSEQLTVRARPDSARRAPDGVAFLLPSVAHSTLERIDSSHAV